MNEKGSTYLSAVKMWLKKHLKKRPAVMHLVERVVAYYPMASMWYLKTVKRNPMRTETKQRPDKVVTKRIVTKRHLERAVMRHYLKAVIRLDQRTETRHDPKDRD